MAKATKRETEKERRERHGDMLAIACDGEGTNGNEWPELEVAVRAATYAAIPGKQKRNAAYMLAARETAVRAACRALRRAK